MTRTAGGPGASPTRRRTGMRARYATHAITDRKPPVLSLVSACAAVNPWTDDTDGRWTGGFAYPPENRYAGEIRDPCDYRSEAARPQPRLGLCGREPLD